MSGALFGFGLFILCVYLGKKYANGYGQTYHFWSDFLEFNSLCAIRVTAYKTEVTTCLSLVNESDFSRLASQILLGQDLSFPLKLTSKEEEYVRAYFYKVKTVDFQNIKAVFDEAQTFLYQKKESARILYEKNAKTCKKLGFLGGIAAFIFVV